MNERPLFFSDCELGPFCDDVCDCVVVDSFLGACLFTLLPVERLNVHTLSCVGFLPLPSRAKKGRLTAVYTHDLTTR